MHKGTSALGHWGTSDHRPRIQGPNPEPERRPGWSPRQESNLHFSLRRAAFYPLNYEEGIGPIEATLST